MEVRLRVLRIESLTGSPLIGRVLGHLEARVSRGKIQMVPRSSRVDEEGPGAVREGASGGR